ncbi:MAG: anthranilate phosphoribosyltransferase [Nitrospirae bacterium]|nr:anthranilate phosphoribosyltransferase [Nitrospirota bacterium]
MIKEAIAKVVDRIHLTEAEAEAAMREIMEGLATPAQIAAYITALRMKGETVDEITGSARVMREKAVRIHVNDPYVVDTCGTGGDRMNTFNISTTTAFVVAGAGITVAKHGNRSVSSSCGSADVLKALGVKIDYPPEKVEECLNMIGIGFLFAPLYHGAMKHAVGPRQETGIRTIFNILGPLANPARASIQVLGVYDQNLTDLMAQVLMNLGSLHFFCVNGLDGLDEITITGKTKICEGKEGKVKCYHIEPADFDLSTAGVKDIVGGTPEQNARIVLDVLSGQKGPKRDIVLLNAAPAIVAAGRAATLLEGIQVAAEAIDRGAAMEKLEGLRAMTNRP